MFKKTSASVFAVCLMVSATHAFAQDQGGLLREHLQLMARENIIQTLDAPEYFNRNVIPGGDNLGNHIAVQEIDMGTFGLTNMADPIEDQDAATKRYVDQSAGGGAGVSDDLGNHTAAQNLNMNFHRIMNLPAPIAGSEPVTLDYLNDLSQTWDHIAKRDINMQNFKLQNMNDLDLRNNSLKRANIHSSTLHSPQSIEGNFNRPIIQEAKIVHSLDMDGAPLINVSDPIGPQDAVNLRTLEAKIVARHPDPATEAELDALFDNLNSYKGANDAEVRSLKSRVTDLEADGSSGSGSIGPTSAEFNELQTNVEGNSVTIGYLNDQVNRITPVEDRVGSLEQRVSTLEWKMDDARIRLINIETRLTTLEAYH